jgi:hypothetical protein
MRKGRIMKAFLIDPFEREVREIEWSANWQDISKILDCHTFTVASIGHNLDDDTIYVDDEGLYRDGQDFFAFVGHPNPLAGYGLLVGTDCEGDSADPKHRLEQVQSKTHFLGNLKDNPPQPQITIIPWG